MIQPQLKLRSSGFLQWLKELTVGEIAARSGVAVSALHFYENERADPQPPHGRQPAALRPRGAAAGRGHQGRAGGRDFAGRDCAQHLNRLPEGRTPNARRTGICFQGDGATKPRTPHPPAEKACATASTDCIGCGCMSINKCTLRNSGRPAGEAGARPEATAAHQVGAEQLVRRRQPRIVNSISRRAARTSFRSRSSRPASASGRTIRAPCARASGRGRTKVSRRKPSRGSRAFSARERSSLFFRPSSGGLRRGAQQRTP